MVSDTLKHYPVLLNEIISIITPQHGGTFIDCTFGQGGYTRKILSYQNTQVIALDRDIESKYKASLISNEFIPFICSSYLSIYFSLTINR